MPAPASLQKSQDTDLVSTPAEMTARPFSAHAPPCVLADQNSSVAEFEDPSISRHLSLLEEIRKAHNEIDEGAPDEAIQICERLLTEYPGVPAIWLGLGKAWLDKKEAQRAIPYFERAVNLRPAYAPNLYHLGEAYRMAGRAKDATHAFTKAIRIDPTYSPSLLYLAIASFQLGELAQGKMWLDQALKMAVRQLRRRTVLRASTALMYGVYGARAVIAPGAGSISGKVAGRLGAYHLKKGRYSTAEEKFRKSLAKNSQDLEAAVGLGRALLEKGQTLEALAVLQPVEKSAPDDSRVLTELGIACFRQNDITTAFEWLQKALMGDPHSARANLFMGWTLLRQEKPDAAMQCFQKCLGADGKSADAALGVSQSFQNLGELDESITWLHKALSINPEHTGSLLAMVKNDKTQRTEATLSRLKRILTGIDIPAADRVQAHFAAGMIEDNRDNIEQAFEHYEAGNSLKDVICDIDAIETAANKIIELFTDTFFETRRDYGVASERPIFIVGMPRSGSTLVEQILASHPDVTGGGELYHFSSRLQTFRKRFRSDGPNPAYALYLDKPMVQSIAEGYLQDLADINSETARFTDKMLFNFWNLGVIALAFPNARIIHTTRDPLDCCTSIYLRDFAGIHMYAYNQTILGRYYGAYQRVMKHWRQVLPIKMIEVQYENMVAESLANMQRIINFCGLEWDERCQEFYNTRRPVSTSSYAQVRRPIYRSSVGRWKRYEAHLGELRAALTTS